MRDLKIKPGMDTPKAKLKNPTPKDADSILKKHMDKRQQEKEPESSDSVRYATNRVEKNMRRGAALAADRSRRMMKHYREKQQQSKEDAAREYRAAEPADMGIGAESGSINAPIEYDCSPAQTAARNEVGKQAFTPKNANTAKSANAAPQERGRQKAVRDAKAAYGRNLAEKKTAERHIVPPPSDRGGTMTTPQKDNSGVAVRGSPAPKSGQVMTKASRAMRVRPTGHAAPNNAPITHRARAAGRRKAQRAMLQDAAKNGGKTARKLGGTAAQAVKTVGRGVASAVSSLLTAGGGAVVLVLLLTVILVAAIVASPFGILFANEPSPDTIPLNAAVAEVSKEVCSTLTELQDGNYDSIDLTGALPGWREVIAVFAARTAGAENGVDVATMDADRVDRLRAVFWDMTEITSEVETIYHDGGEDGEDWTERILHLTVMAKSAEEMSTVYRFTAYQKKALAELLDDPALLDALLYDLDSLQYDTALLRRALPRNLSKERRAVVEWAFSLVGKVNYFWGGKSLVFGWDDRWGQLAKVTADGRSTTGTYRPYGLDCSGMVDWAFYNATDGSYVIGHGGGAAMQHSYCTPVRWEDAQIGDLAFYPDDEHVGIVAGWDKDGNIQIVHCASSYNNVVITGKEGFAAVGRPVYYTND